MWRQPWMRRFWKMVLLVLAALATTATAAQQLPDVVGLRGEGDYRFVRLRWEYPNSEPHSFHVHYCELQTWAPNSCRTKLLVMEDASGLGPPLSSSSGPPLRMYTVIVNGLKMATNYSFEVWPLQLKKASTRFLSQPPAQFDHPNRILVTTKGFSAKASLCLPDESEVEVLTGPYFSGRIGVEVTPTSGKEAGDKSCWLEGDGANPKESYTLRIRHGQCGSSRLNATTVATYILVQENLPILTHSTRRFLVLCTFQPETLTVRAGLNLPSTSPGSVEGAVEPVLLQEVTNNQVHAAPLLQTHHQHEDHHHGHHNQHHHHSGESKEAKGVLAGVIVAIGLVGVGLALWWYLPNRTSSQGSVAILSEECGATIYDNYENALRDSSLDSPVEETSLDCATSWNGGGTLERANSWADDGGCFLSGSDDGGSLVSATNRVLVRHGVAQDAPVFTICQPANSSTLLVPGSHNQSEA